jgi:hypothetical protein
LGKLTDVDVPTKCREPFAVLLEHFVRQPRYPTLWWDRRLCVPALLPVYLERTMVLVLDFTNTSGLLSLGVRVTSASDIFNRLPRAIQWINEPLEDSWGARERPLYAKKVSEVREANFSPVQAREVDARSDSSWRESEGAILFRTHGYKG